MLSKTILITGAGSGLGKGTALGLARAGHTVIATARQPKQIEELKALASSERLPLKVEKFDLSNNNDHHELAAKYGDTTDILVNNAAVGQAGPIAEIPTELVRNVFEVNIFKTLDLTQRFAAKFAEKKSGKIIFVSSIAGFMSVPFLAPYVASKHALEAIAKLMKDELEPLGVKVATINPGPFKTGFNDRMVDSIKSWYDPEKNFTTEAALKKTSELFANDDFQPDPADVIDFMIDLIPKDTHKFRNVFPSQYIAAGQEYQQAIWSEQVK